MHDLIESIELNPVSDKVIHIVENSQKQYQCSSCNKSFYHTKNLKRHEKIHTDEKPYGCNYCTLKFREKHSLKRHEKTHISKGHTIKNNEAEMIHFCGFCSKDCVGKENYLVHMKLHKKKKQTSLLKVQWLTFENQQSPTHVVKYLQLRVGDDKSALVPFSPKIQID